MAIKKVLVIGAGQMGSGIAQVMAQGGMEVVLQDIEQRFVDKGMAGIEKNLAKLVEKGKLTPADKDAVAKRLCGVVELDAASCNVDLAIEVVVENMNVKIHLPETRRLVSGAYAAGLQHLVAAGDRDRRHHETANPGLRHAFLQSRAGDGAGGSSQGTGHQ